LSTSCFVARDKGPQKNPAESWEAFKRKISEAGSLFSGHGTTLERSEKGLFDSELRKKFQ